MKYFETLIEDQETTISILYDEQKVKIYSSEPKTIQRLTKALGKPQTKYIKSKTYWSGASWIVDFFELDKLKVIIVREAFIDNKLKPKVKEAPKAKGKIKKKEEKASKVKKEKTLKKEVKTKKQNSKVENKKKKEKVKVKKNTVKTDKKKVEKTSKEAKFEQIQFSF